MTKNVDVLVEGLSDQPIARRILEEEGLSLGRVFGLRGKTHLDKLLPQYNKAAQHFPYLVLRDLDAHDCAPTLIREKLPRAGRFMRFRVVVREAEAWLLSDAERFATFFKVSTGLIPGRPEELRDPKQALVNIVRRSRSREVRESVVPVDGTGATVGPAYTSVVTDYVVNHWRPSVAAKRADSLARCLRALRTLR